MIGNTKGWTITLANYNTQDWKFYSTALLSASDQSKFAENNITFDYTGMWKWLDGVLEFYIDPASDCVTKNYVVSIEPYTSKVTWSGSVPFTTPGTQVKCTMKVC